MSKVINHRLDVWKEEPLYWDMMAGIDKRLYESTIPDPVIEITNVHTVLIIILMMH
jgi:hypothetical protein